MTTIRCSSLPLACKCPASQTPPAVRVERDDSAARLGNAVHEVLTEWVRRDCIPDVDMIAAAWGVSAPEASRLAWNGWEAWRTHLARWFTAPECERQLYAPGLSGRADVISCEEGARTAYVLDWKTGHTDGDFLDQMRGYALLTLERHQAAQVVRVAIVRLQEQTIEWLQFERGGLAAWWERTREELAQTELYRPGAHCQYCPRALECPAHGGELLHALTVLAPGELVATGWLPDAMATALDKARLVEGAIEMLRRAVKTEVVARGGSLPTSDGRELAVTEQTRREIDTAKAWPLLKEHMTEQELVPLVELGVTRLNAALMGRAARGQKKAYADSILERLADAGAILTKTIQRLECKTNVAATVPAAITTDAGAD